MKLSMEVLTGKVKTMAECENGTPLMEKAKKLKDSYETLLSAMPTIGETSDGPNGIESLANRVANAKVLVPNGTVQISQQGNSVYKGDLVCITQEPEKIGPEFKIVNGGGKLLAVSDNSATGKQTDNPDPIAIVFAQDGSTWLKIAKWNKTNNQWTLGPSLLLVERELDFALCIQDSWTNPISGTETTWPYYAIFYQEDGSGIVQFWRTESSEDAAALIVTHKCTDIWTDEAPTNLCGAKTPSIIIPQSNPMGVSISQGDLITLAYAGTDGSFKVVGVYLKSDWDQEASEYLYSAGIWAEKTIMPGEYTGIQMREGKHEDFTIAPNDGQEYANGAWNITEGTENGAVWLTYPGQDGNRYILELWIVKDNSVYGEEDTTNRDFKYTPGACKRLIQDNYQSCGVGLFGLGRGIRGTYGKGPYFVGVVSRLSGPNQRAGIAVEGWTGGYPIQLTPLWFGEEDRHYSSNIGLLGVSKMGDNKEIMAIGYSVEGTYHMFLIGGTDELMVGSPQIEICSIGVSAKLAESYKGCALVFQREDSIYLQQIGYKVVAVPVEGSRYASAKAVTGGRPGQEIKVTMIE